MRIRKSIHVISVAATALFLTLGPVLADSRELDQLFLQLQSDDVDNWPKVEGEIQSLWSRSGSASMDHLLERGESAILDNDFPKAVEHLSALIDHAPDFAQGWNVRASAFYMMDEYGLAISDLKQTLILNPRHFGALSGLGLIYEQLGQPKVALRIYIEAQAVHPHRSNINDAIIRLTKELEGVSL